MRVALMLFLLVLMITFYNCSAQQYNVKQLLDKIDNAVNTINEGQFTLHNNYYKVSVGEDSIKRNDYTKCYFKKLLSDSLIGFQLASFSNNGYEQVYDGNTLLKLTPWNQTLEITDKAKYPNKVKEIRDNHLLFPFFRSLNKFMQFFNNDTMYSKVTIKGKELFKGEECYVIKAGASPNKNITKTESIIYVSTKSFLPVRQQVIFETIIGQAKEIQVFDNWTSGFIFGSIPKDKFSKQILSAYSKEKMYNPIDEVSNSQLLPVGTIAPEWELPLISGKKLKSTDLKGKIVILDFWFKACAPCQKQMIELQKLHEKYDTDKVVFIGINTIDDPIKDKLLLFLKNRNITMTSVYNGKSVESLYKAYSSPALFVIDKEGKIIFTLDGSSNTLLNDVSEMIEQHL